VAAAGKYGFLFAKLKGKGGNMNTLRILILSAIISAQGLACGACAKSKGGLQTSKPGGNGQLARVVGVTTTGQRPASFNDAFFKGVGDDRPTSQPVAIPNGDGGDYKKIFR
jgi:hypothetical protein